MEFGMKLNPNVLVDTTSNSRVDRFYPAEGYALWRDDEEGNLRADGEPVMCYGTYYCQKRFSEAQAPHIRAKLIDETVEVC